MAVFSIGKNCIEELTFFDYNSRYKTITKIQLSQSAFYLSLHINELHAGTYIISVSKFDKEKKGLNNELSLLEVNHKEGSFKINTLQ